MIHVETVDLAARGVQFPSGRVGMVIAQPHVPLECLSAAEPYQWRPDVRAQQMAVLTRTLTIAKASPHGAPKTHFTVFPEYSVPGLAGVELIDITIAGGDWPNGSVVIGGTDALTQAEYAGLLQHAATHVDNARHSPNHVPPQRWVNCAITWVKGADGTVERWVQPKLHPAREEMNIEHQHMFCGSSIFMFKGRFENNAPFRFGTLVCFDWIANVAARTPFQWMLNDLEQQANGNQLPLSWLFIIQRNKKPSHDTFLNAVTSFFNQIEFPNALRERACLIFANTAGLPTPGRVNQFGACSVVSSPQSLFMQPSCVPTFAGGGARFRDGSNLLTAYKDAVFRERGACIHSFVQVNPGSLVAGAVGRSFPVENAYVFPISGTPEPRAPGAEVPASIKWLNDELDAATSVSTLHAAAPLSVAVTPVHQANVSALRAISPQAATRAIGLACAQESASQHADQWAAAESEALQHLVHTLDILGISYPLPTITGEPAHALLTVQNQTVDLIAIRGTSHEMCIQHSKRFIGSGQRQTLLVSRDQDNIKWHRKLGSFLEPVTGQPGKEPKITDPASGTLHLGYQNLLEIFLASNTAAALGVQINAALAA